MHLAEADHFRPDRFRPSADNLLARRPSDKIRWLAERRTNINHSLGGPSVGQLILSSSSAAPVRDFELTPSGVGRR